MSLSSRSHSRRVFLDFLSAKMMALHLRIALNYLTIEILQHPRSLEIYLLFFCGHEALAAAVRGRHG